MSRPPPGLIFLSVLLLALGSTGGALMSLLRPQIEAFASERIFAAREVHSLSGSRDYDADVVAEIVFAIEAGLSFFHTHAEGLGLVLLFTGILVASLVEWRWLRRALYPVVGLSALFPLGYLASSAMILFLGKDRGGALAERLMLVPFGSSAILGLAVLGAVVCALLLTGRGRHDRVATLDPRPVTPEALPSGAAWPRPPGLLVLAAALSITLAELGGAVMGGFAPEIDRFTTVRALERPDVHGLVGVDDVDREITEEIRVKVDAGLRLFHLHGEGIGLMIFALGLVISSAPTIGWLRHALHGLVVLGGLGFSLGYLVWSGFIPLLGIDPARVLSATIALVPAGGALLLALWVQTVLLAIRILRGRPRGPDAGEPRADSTRAPGMRLPPLPLIFAAVILLVLAEVGGGAMARFKLDLDRARRAQIEARPAVHGLVGVRQIDGPVVDNLLSRADFALRLFHLHGEGMALVMVAAGLMVENFVAAHLLRRALHTLLAGGGFLYPFGYLLWSAQMPILGLQPGKELAEWLLWVPFGGAVIVGMIVLTVVLASQALFGKAPRG